MDNNLHNIDEIFAKALSEHSMEPPAYVWDNIKGQLDATSGEHIDNIFAKTLGEHTLVPPAYVWDNIKGQLDADSGKRRIRIGWIIGTASAVIFAFVGGYFIATSGDANETHVSEKISNTHNAQIDVNHFWDLRTVETVGESHSGGQTFTTTTPVDTYTNTNEGGNGDLQPEDNRTAPYSINGEHKLIVPSKNQESGAEDDGKKTDAVTTDVNGPVESQIGTHGSTIVTALNDDKKVIVENQSTQTTTTQTEESRIETVNPNDESTFDNRLDENGNPFMIKNDNLPTFTVLPYFAPTYTFRNSSMFNTNGIQNAFDTLNGNSKFNEKVNFSYSAGVLVGYNFTKNLTVFIGASYNSFSNTTSRNDIHTRAFDQINPGDTSTAMITSAGDINGVNVVPTATGSAEDPTYMLQDNMIGKVTSVTQTFSYIEVPVMVRYRVGGPKIGLILTGGIGTGFIVQNDVLVQGANGSRNCGPTSQIRNFNMNASFGIGIEAKLLPFMYLNIEPTFKYSFLNWSMDSRFQMNPISLGLNTGLAFKF
jgi:hypothetical protein